MKLASRILSPIALAAYLLATLLGAAHTHDHGSQCDFVIGAHAVDAGHETAAPAQRCTHPHPHAALSAADDPAESEQHPHSHHPQDDDCLVCEFLAQKFVSAPLAAVATTGRLITPAPAGPVTVETADPVALPPSRAPPASA